MIEEAHNASLMGGPGQSYGTKYPGSTKLEDQIKNAFLISLASFSEQKKTISYNFFHKLSLWNDKVWLLQALIDLTSDILGINVN